MSKAGIDKRIDKIEKRLGINQETSVAMPDVKIRNEQGEFVPLNIDIGESPDTLSIKTNEILMPTVLVGDK